MSAFVFVESNTTGTGKLAVERLVARGEQVTFLTREPGKYPFTAARAPNLEIQVLDTNTVGAVIQAARELQRRGRADALLTLSEFYVEVTAEVAARCGLRGLDPAAAAACRDKHATRLALQAAGLPTPAFGLLESEGEALVAADRVAYPCVVKPPADSSSHGVRRVADRDELLAHFRELHGWKENVRGQALSGHVLVESLLDGPEYSVETMTRPDKTTEVIGVTDKHLSDPPHFVELGHDFPTALDEPARGAVADAARRALAAVKYDFGPAHTEVRLTRAGAVVVEINPRLAGGMIPEIVAHATGVDLLEAWFELLLGRDVDLSPRRREVSSIRYLTAPCAGRLAGVAGVGAASAHPLVRDVYVAPRIGAQVRPARDAYDRLGHVIAVGPEREAVRRAAEAGRRSVAFEIDGDAA